MGQKTSKWFQTRAFTLNPERSLDPQAKLKESKETELTSSEGTPIRNRGPRNKGFFLHESPASSGQGQQEW